MKDKPGYDGRWYTDMNKENAKGDPPAEDQLDDEKEWEKEKKDFWQETTSYTPESRKEVRSETVVTSFTLIIVILFYDRKPGLLKQLLIKIEKNAFVIQLLH